ncbi:neuropeptide Y receptor type 2 [Arapaima gigas]
MDSRIQHNTTQEVMFQPDSNSSRCCSVGTPMLSDNSLLGLQDSTKLIGVQVVLILAYSTIILLGGLAVHVSTVTLNVIALDRHRCIVYHLETKMSKDMCFVVIGVTWMFSAILASPLAIFREYGKFDFSPEQSIQVCTEKWPGNNRDGTVYSIFTIVLQYVLPLSIISFAYVRIWSKLKNHVSPGTRSDRHNRRKKTTKMLVTVVVVFAVSWLPFHAFQLATDIDSSVLDMKDFKLLYTVFHVVAMCSTFANPILYGWMNNNYRMAFLTVFKCDQRLDCAHPKGRASARAKKALNSGDVVSAELHATNV